MKEITTLVDKSEQENMKKLIRSKMNHMDTNNKSEVYDMILRVIGSARKTSALQIWQIEEFFGLANE